MSVRFTGQLSSPLQAVNAVTVIATPDNVNAQMIIQVLNVGFYGTLTLKRVVNSVESDVRGATNIAVSGASTELVVDYECPLDTSITYRAYLDANDPVVSSPATIVTDGRTFWLKDVVLGAFSTKVNIQSMSDVSRPAVILGKFNVIGRSRPIIVTDVRSGREGTMTLTGVTHVDNLNIANIIASGNTLLLQCPGSANFPDMYFQAGDVTESWNGAPSYTTIHTWSIPFTETDPPAQSAISLDFNSWLLVTQFTTWQTVLNDRTDWTEVFTTPYNTNDLP
jgi:hypothetical protein